MIAYKTGYYEGEARPSGDFGSLAVFLVGESDYFRQLRTYLRVLKSCNWILIELNYDYRAFLR